jgi:arylformamidase
MPLSDRTPHWPGSPGASISELSSVDAGDDATVSMLSMDVHTGTHVDAPAHMIAGGATVDEYELELGMGTVAVVDTGDARAIDAATLAGIDWPEGVTRILLRTSNSRSQLDRGASFVPNYSALTLSGAQWLVNHDVRLVGIDYLSIQLFDDPIDTHLELFRGGTTILEGLQLGTVEPGLYELICLPLRLEGCEAAPVRAVLREIGG